MSSISTLEVAWENNIVVAELVDETYFCWRVAHTNKLELLKWAREEKKCGGMNGRLDAAAEQGNLEMVKYCVANECPIDEVRVQVLPQTVISSASNTYAKKSKRLGILDCHFGG